MATFEVRAVGVVRSTRHEPRDDGWDAERARIELIDPYGPDALVGLDAFSHVEVLYLFDRVAPGDEAGGVRHPREDPQWPAVGIFAQRGRTRPNRLGLTVCRVVGVEGSTVSVAGLDAVDGTPVLDLKPYMAEFGPRGPVRQPAWSHELMAAYWTAPPSG